MARVFKAAGFFIHRSVPEGLIHVTSGHFRASAESSASSATRESFIMHKNLPLFTRKREPNAVIGQTGNTVEQKRTATWTSGPRWRQVVATSVVSLAMSFAVFGATSPAVAAPPADVVIHVDRHQVGTSSNSTAAPALAQPFSPATTGAAYDMTLWFTEPLPGLIGFAEIRTVSDSGVLSDTPIAGGQGTATFSPKSDSTTLPDFAFWQATIAFPDSPILTQDASYALVWSMPAFEDASFEVMPTPAGTSPIQFFVGGQWRVLYPLSAWFQLRMFTLLPAPTLAPGVECRQEGTVNIPTVTGVVYSRSRAGSTVAVTAVADTGYIIPVGPTTSWTFDLSPRACSVTPVAPTLAAADACGGEGTFSIPTVTGVGYSQSRTGNTVTVGATADIGYAIPTDATTTWSLDISPTPCPTPAAAIPADGNLASTGTGNLSPPLIGAVILILLGTAAALLHRRHVWTARPSKDRQRGQGFTSPIVAHRGLQANARNITTSDEVQQELTNLNR
jgi:hypothetical protein